MWVPHRRVNDCNWLFLGDMDNFWKRQRVNAVPDGEKRGSNHLRRPVCDLNQLSVHVHVLHWHPTQSRWKD